MGETPTGRGMDSLVAEFDMLGERRTLRRISSRYHHERSEEAIETMETDIDRSPFSDQIYDQINQDLVIQGDDESPYD